MNTKADYVRKALQTKNHTCHWLGCTKQVPPAMWGCKEHWYKLPQSLRSMIWRTFVPGQEEAGSPSSEYIKAARAVQDWIKKNS